MRIQPLDAAQSALRTMQANYKGTYLQEAAAKLFVHGKNEKRQISYRNQRQQK